MIRRRPTAPARPDRRPGPWLVGITLLALLLAGASFVPRSGSDGDGIAERTAGGASPAADDSGAAGPARVTPAMQREIDRVVAEGAALPSLRGRPDPLALATREVRCARFEQLTYCLHLGWTDATPGEARARMATAAARPTGSAAVETTGDLDPLADLTRSARLAPRARAAADRAELTAAARAVAKVWTLRHEVLGEPYPRGFWSRHADARPTTTGTYAARGSATATASKKKQKTIKDYPKKDTVLNPKQVREQVRSYWCGPASTQMIVWGWTGKKRTQRHWAGHLGTTGSGTSISRIVQTINKKTGWDNKKHAGPYITLDVKGWGYGSWYLLLARHIHDYQAPLVLHPILVKKYFPYLDDDASGHFQVGRGYFTRKDGVRMISYFEPWNQRRFDPSEPFIKRVQWQKAYRSYRANLAHPYHNIGV